MIQSRSLFYRHTMKKTTASILSIAIALLGGFVDADAKKRQEGLIKSVVSAYESNHSFEMPAAGTIEVAFSPSEGSEPLVIKVIDSAKKELRILSYSFTSAPIVA